MKKPILIILSILCIDQIVKFKVKTTMLLGNEHVITNWFIIHFTENNGMAFGYEFAGEWGKLALSLFRIVAVTGIGYYLWHCVKNQFHSLFIIALSFIFAGALGNIIDSTFYGLMFSESDFEVAKFLGPEGGYGSLFHGKVVDMLYFPLIRGTFPSWFPFWGNEPFEFFRPVFNISDSAITIGVSMILLFQKRIFKPQIEESESEGESGNTFDNEIENNEISQPDVIDEKEKSV